MYAAGEPPPNEPRAPPGDETGLPREHHRKPLPSRRRARSRLEPYTSIRPQSRCPPLASRDCAPSRSRRVVIVRLPVEQQQHRRRSPTSSKLLPECHCLCCSRALASQRARLFIRDWLNCFAFQRVVVNKAVSITDTRLPPASASTFAQRPDPSAAIAEGMHP